MKTDRYALELKELIARSRNTALDLGYDYISSMHFLIADCERKERDSILHFCFAGAEEFEAFKRSQTLGIVNDYAARNKTLPLTQEAEQNIRRIEELRQHLGQTRAYPCHFFIAAFSDPGSAIFDHFSYTEQLSANLSRYYEQAGAFTESPINQAELQEKGIKRLGHQLLRWFRK